MKILTLIQPHVLGIILKIFFLKKYFYRVWCTYICWKDSKIFVGDNTMIGPFVFVTTEGFSHSKENPQAHSGMQEMCILGIM